MNFLSFNSTALLHLAITPANSDIPIGLTSAYSANLQSGTCYVGTVISPKYIRTGAGFKATLLFIAYLFKTWPFLKIYMELPEFNMDQFNSGSNRYFHLEGRLKNHYYFNGTYFDELICAFYLEDLKRVKNKIALLKFLKNKESSQ
jgi:RimJ/RimL family protein N-acetyltransferase